MIESRVTNLNKTKDQLLTNHLDQIASGFTEANFGLISGTSANNNLKLSDELLAFLQFLPGSAFIEDRNCRFLGINNYGAKKIVGLKHPNQIVNKSHTEITKMGTWQVSQEDVSVWEKSKKQVMFEEKSIVGALFDPYLIADGSLILQVGTILPLYNNAGKVTGSFTIALDSTNKISPEGIYYGYRVLYKDKKQALTRSLKHLTGKNYTHFQDITARELECLIQLSKGFSAKQIAAYLKLSSRTVETYLQTIKEKVGMKDKAELVKFFSESLSSFKNKL